MSTTAVIFIGLFAYIFGYLTKSVLIANENYNKQVDGLIKSADELEAKLKQLNK